MSAKCAVVVAILSAAILFLLPVLSVSECYGQERPGGNQRASTAAVKVNNTVCPVSGEKVDMNNPVTVEYNGKTYNLCCPACIVPFKSDPQKYAAKAESEQK